MRMASGSNAFAYASKRIKDRGIDRLTHAVIAHDTDCRGLTGQ
jgi:hypothetical protein